MSPRKLDAVYISFRLQIGAHDYARVAATRSTITPALLQQLGLSHLVGELARDRRKKILEQFEMTGRQLRRQCFTDLVAAFEADLFKVIGTATSKVRHILNQHYEPDYPFAACSSDLARTTSDFANLGGYKSLLARTKASEHDPRRELWDVISHRDFLVHGERWEPQATPPTIDAAYATMSAELEMVMERSPSRR